jgi:hypothetical protein
MLEVLPNLIGIDRAWNDRGHDRMGERELEGSLRPGQNPARPILSPSFFDVDGARVAGYQALAACWAVSTLGAPAAVVS